MISGEDTVLVVATNRPGQVISNLLTSWLSRWPSMLVAAGAATQDAFVSWATQAANIAEDKGEILIARDRRMELDWEERGYFEEDDGEGPVGLFYEPRPSGILRAKALDDPYSRRDFEFEPYEVFLLGQGFALITLVTPNRDSEFTRSLISALGEQAHD